MTTSNSFNARFGLLLTFLFSCLTHVLAQTPAASTFVRGGGPRNLTVAINVPDNSTDSLYMHINGPATNSWIAFGFGDSMPGSLIFVAYESANKTGVTLSPRLATGHQQPTHTDKVNITILPGSGVSNNIFNVNAMCTGCREWDGGAINVKSSSQNMIWAIGPAQTLASDALDATIVRHQVEGTFALSMNAATGPAGVPVTASSAGSVGSGSDDDDSDEHGPSSWNADGKVIAHALLMIGSFLILFPGGYLALRVFEKVVAHAAVQTIAMLVVIVSTALGVSISKGMNISPNLTNPHQIIGFIVLVLVLASWGIGLGGHMIFRKTGAPAKFMIGHRILGPSTILLGLVNVCVGFNFAGNRRPIIGFIIVTILMVIIVSASVLLARRRRMKKGVMNTPAAMNFREAHAQGGNPPPTYPQATGQNGGPAIPLQTYQPQQGAVYR